MFGINWRELRLPPPPGLFIVRWLIKNSLGNKKGKLPFQWWVSQRYLLDEGELKGFIRGEDGFFESLIPPILAIGCLHDNKEVVWIENAREFVRQIDNGAKGTILPDHKGIADIFLIQLAFAVKGGMWNAAIKRFLAVVGMMYASRYPFETLLMRAGNIITAVPPTMTVPKSAQKENRRIWEALKEQYPAALLIHYIGLIFAEGTRSKGAKIIKPPSGIVAVLKHPGSIYLPTAIEGSQNFQPPADERGIPLPLFTARTKVIFGKILTFEHVDAMAKELVRNYRVSYSRAFIDYIFRQIALLHIEQGDPSYAGYYERPLGEIYVAR